MAVDDRTSGNDGTRAQGAPASAAPITLETLVEARSDAKLSVRISSIVMALVAVNLAATFFLYGRIADLSETVGGLAATLSNLPATVEKIESGQQAIAAEFAADGSRLDAVETGLDDVEGELADISRTLAEVRDGIRRGSLLMPGTLRAVPPPWTVEALDDYLLARVDADDLHGLVLHSTADGQWYLATEPDELFWLPARPLSVRRTVAYKNAPVELRSYADGVLGLVAR